MRLRRPVLSIAGLLAFTTLACTESADPIIAPAVQPQFGQSGQQGLDRAIEAQTKHTPALMRLSGVQGTAVGLLPSGQVGIRVFVAGPVLPPLPSALEGVPVSGELTGLFMARSDPTQRLRPAALGYSVGHPSITAGSIGFRVVDVFGDVHFLSNNHVLAAANQANLGDPILQPGTFDGGTLPADQIGTLSARQLIDFNGGSNLMDAALARTSRAEVSNASPTDDGYGTPSSTIWGDGNGDGLFDNRNALLGLTVEKYGRTTRLTEGTITGVNANVSVCYDAILWICLAQANFVDQIIIEPGTFSDGGDSGSGIVSVAGLHPVGLLFAGSPTITIANRIDLVLNHFNVTLDDDGTPPTPLTDIAVTDVSAPAFASEGDVVAVDVTIRNVGNQAVSSGFDVTLEDATDNAPIGTQGVPGLAAGATTTLTFSWNTAGASIGPHTLRATQNLADDVAGNDAATATMQVNSAGTIVGIHVGDLDDLSTRNGKTWSGIVEVTVHDANHQPINGATVMGVWEPGGLASDVCTTGELGGNGTCIFLFASTRMKRLTFTVNTVTMPGETYQAGDNHDPDGDSDGTVIVLIRP